MGMAPFASLGSTGAASENPQAVVSSLREQWINPSDVFTVLLILGGDIVARALAQLAGSGLAPVAFSFGWVGYSVSALMSAVGENSLMPNPPDCQCKVVNGKTGHVIGNTSWIIGRLVRDFHAWSHREVTKKTEEVLEARWKELQASDPRAGRPRRAGLVVAVYEPSTEHPAAIPKHDLVYWCGVLVVILQIGIAAIPCGLFGDWATLFVTGCGTCLALAMGCLSQWGEEKWACRRRSNDSYVLTKGNGSQYAIVILGNGHGLNLEDLGAGQANLDASTNRSTRIAVFAMSGLWILLLIVASGFKMNTWFLLGVGVMGILQNVFVAGYSRRPEAFGIPLRYIAVYGHTKVMQTLLAVEKDYPCVGRSMLGEFFPGGLHDDEMEIWRQLEETAAASRVPRLGHCPKRPSQETLENRAANEKACEPASGQVSKE